MNFAGESMGQRFYHCPNCRRKVVVDEERFLNLHIHIRCRQCKSTWWEVVLPPSSQSEAKKEPVELGGDSKVDDTKDIEARRLARFIVSEIKLYHQDEIDKATSRQEVLESVAKDLELALKHFLGRVQSDVTHGEAIFNSVVEEILCRGKR